MKNYGIKDSKGSEHKVVLTKVNISGNVCGEFVEVSVNQVYENRSSDTVEAVYTFPIPETAVVSGFKATLGGKTIRAEVEDKREMEKYFKKEVNSKHSIFTLKEFNQNTFQITIGNILPNETVKIKLSYIDQMEYEDKDYELVIPNMVAPSNIDGISREELKEGMHNGPYKFTINLLVESLTKLSLSSPSHPIEIEEENENLYKVTYRNDSYNIDSDFILNLNELEIEEASGMFYEYKENKESKGILYLRLMPSLKVERDIPKNYIFVVDISDTMAGRKIQEEKDALQLCIRNLSEQDTFNIVAFGRETYYFSNIGSVLFTQENLNRATDWINNLEAMEDGDIFEAVRFALNLKDISRENNIILFTDDLAENETEILEYVKENIGDSRIYTFGIDTSVNSYFINKLAQYGYGRAEFIYPGEAIDDIVLRQFSRIENAQIDVLGIDWGSMKVDETYPRSIDYMYDREPFSIFARVSGEIAGEVKINGKVGNDEYSFIINLDKLNSEENANLIQRVWARKRIESIEGRIRGERGTIVEAMKNKVVEISKKYAVISKETTFMLIEEREEPLYGMRFTNIIPLKIYKNIEGKEEEFESSTVGSEEQYFLESPRFLYRQITKKDRNDGKRTYGNEYLDKEYSRDKILKILAKHQFADGSFVDYDKDNHNNKIKTTAMVLIAFTLGKEDINVYANQLNKSISYVIKALDEEIKEFDEKLYLLTLIAFKACIKKDILKGRNKEQLELKVRDIRDLLMENDSEKMRKVFELWDSKSMKAVTATIFNVSEDGALIEEKIVINEEKESIYNFAKLGVLKALLS